ncbi:hypothetical protein PI126_g9483 [Phytophthora idaei]|nr:hypothetical protein PI126_g9483 [Phytophthora idaei]
MTENSGVQESAPLERKDKNKKKRDDEQSKTKKRRRHFREEAQGAPTQEGPQTQEVKPELDQHDPDRVESATSLSPSAIVEMFHLQDEENSSSTSVAITARYLVENETSGDFYQVRTRQRKQHAYASDHNRHQRSSLVKAQQRIRDESNKAENSMCWAILQRDGEKAVVVMLLGIVAGMCWMDAMNLRSGSGSSPRREFDSFACTYSAGSNRSRQTHFILFKYPSQLSIMNYRLIRKLSHMNPYRRYNALDGGSAELTSYRLLQAATAFISSALVVLLIGSPSALRLSRAQEASTKWCEDVAPTAPRFQSGIVVLQVCAILNTILITAAWLLVALQRSMTMSSSTSNRSRNVELQEALEDKEKRIYKLQGTDLEGSSAEELKSLIQLHQRAIELTEGVLVSKLQALHRPTAAV